MTWLIVMQYQYQKCLNHNPVVSSFMTYHRVCSNSNTTGYICGAGTDYPSESPCCLSCLSGVRLVHLVKLHVLMVLVPCCDVRYDFCVKTSGSGVLAYLCYLYLFTYTGIQHAFLIICCSCRLTLIGLVSHISVSVASFNWNTFAQNQRSE